MVKTQRIQVDEEDQPPMSAWLIGFAAWFIPGIGHVLLGRWFRAALMGGVVWFSFFIGFAMGGHMFDLSVDPGGSVLLQVPPMIANIGTGSLYIISWLLGSGFAIDPARAARVTYEYGNTFLLIAGLMNYLNMLDAFDIAVGRKS